MTIERIWTPHRDYAGEPMPVGVFRDEQCEQCEIVLSNGVRACRYCATGVPVEQPRPAGPIRYPHDELFEPYGLD